MLKSIINTNSTINTIKQSTLLEYINNQKFNANIIIPNFLIQNQLFKRFLSNNYTNVWIIVSNYLLK